MRDTLGNDEWLRENESAIKKLLPGAWTDMHDLSPLQLGFQLKLMGIDWRSEQEFGAVMVFFEKAGFLLRDGLTVKANPDSVFLLN